MSRTGGRADLGGKTVKMLRGIALPNFVRLEIRNGTLIAPEETTAISAAKGSRVVLNGVELQGVSLLMFPGATCHIRGSTVAEGNVRVQGQGTTLVMHGCRFVHAPPLAFKGLLAKNRARVFFMDVDVVGAVTDITEGAHLDMQGGGLHEMATISCGASAMLRDVRLIGNKSAGLGVLGEGSRLDMVGGVVRDNDGLGLLFSNGGHGSVRNVSLGRNKMEKMVVGAGSVVTVVESLEGPQNPSDFLVHNGGVLRLLVGQREWVEYQS